ncbi:MAG: hypothetical protein ABIF77_10415 [bacterium]
MTSHLNRVQPRTNPYRRVVLLGGMLLLVISLTGLAGCRDQEQSADLAKLLDAGSMTRLEKLPEAGTVLVSLHGNEPLAEMPQLSEGGRQLGKFGSAILLEVPRGDLSALAGLEQIQSAIVWGAGEVVGRLDPRLRNTLLTMLDSDRRDDEPLDVIATFAEDSPGLAESLTEMGAVIGSHSGRVVTLKATVGNLFAILARPDLTELSQPSLLQPMNK